MKKILRGSIIAVSLVAVSYWGGVNALLASPWGEQLFNLQPDFVQIHFSRAWTVVPGQVEVRDFRLWMRDPLVEINLTADTVRGNLRPWQLIDSRFVANQVVAEGVTLHVQDVSVGGVVPPGLRFLSLEFEDLNVKHLREVWIDRMHYTGDATATGGLVYEPFRRLRIDDGHITDQGSTLEAVAGNQVAFQSIDARVTLQETDLSGFDFAALGGLTAQVKLSAAADPSFLNSYLTNVAGLSTLRIKGPPGQLEVAVSIDRGVVADGATLSYGNAQVSVRLPVVVVSGAAAITGTTSEGRLALAVEISHARLRRHDGEALVDADRFSLRTQSSAQLTSLPDVDAVLTLHGGHVRNLVVLNQFVPEGAGLHLTTGSGVMEGHLKLDSVPPRARGGFELTATDVALTNRSALLKGRLLVHGEVHSLDLATGAMDLSGSTVTLEAATLVAKGRTWKNVWLSAAADPCLLNPPGKVKWSAGLALGASNLEPVLAIISANAPVPAGLWLLANSANVKAEATVLVREDSVELPRLVLTSQNVRLEGALVLREAAGADPHLEPWGSVLAHLGVFSAGVEFDGPKVTVVLGDLKRWMQRRSLTPTSRLKP